MPEIDYQSDLLKFIHNPMTAGFAAMGATYLLHNDQPGLIIVLCPASLRDSVRLNLIPAIPKSLRMEFAEDA